jgi:hypothetical protein
MPEVERSIRIKILNRIRSAEWDRRASTARISQVRDEPNMNNLIPPAILGVMGNLLKP